MGETNSAILTSYCSTSRRPMLFQVLKANPILLLCVMDLNQLPVDDFPLKRLRFLFIIVFYDQCNIPYVWLRDQYLNFIRFDDILLDVYLAMRR
jgi:hypothetical protein